MVLSWCISGEIQPVLLLNFDGWGRRRGKLVFLLDFDDWERRGGILQPRASRNANFWGARDDKPVFSV